MKTQFPRVHVNRLRKLAKDLRQKEESMQLLYGDPWPRSQRVSNLADMRSIEEILWCIEKAEAA